VSLGKIKYLEYSEAGRSPHESDLGAPKEPKPDQFTTKYMDHVYENVNKAFNYNPPVDQKPKFTLETKQLVVNDSVANPIQAARQKRKTTVVQQKSAKIEKVENVRSSSK
jgi:hypothetical protein